MIAGSVRSSETNRCGDAALYFHHITDLLSSQGRLYRAQKFADTGVNHLDIIMQFLEKGNNMLSCPYLWDAGRFFSIYSKELLPPAFYSD